MRYWIFLLILISSSCKTLDLIVYGNEGKDVIQIATFGSEKANYKTLDKVRLKGFNINDYQNKIVSRYVKSFQSPSGLKQMQSILKRGELYFPLMKKIFREVNVPEDLIYLPIIESGFKIKARSYAAAVGPWQFMRATGYHYDLKVSYWHDDRQDIVKSTRAAAYHLKYLYKRFGNWLLVLAAYNAGGGRIRKGMARAKSDNFWVMLEKKTISRQTAHYVPKFIAATLIAKNPQKYGLKFNASGEDEFEKLRSYTIDDATDINLLAEKASMKVSDFLSYNTALKHWMTPPSIKYDVYFPEKNYDIFLKNWKDVLPEDRITYRRYFVNIGDNLTSISKQFSIPINPLVEVNKIKSKNAISAGKYIYIPIRGVDKAKEIDDKSRITKGQLRKKKKYTYFFHEISDGDNLYSVALKYNVDMRKILKWNNLKNASHIRNGMLLLIKENE